MSRLPSLALGITLVSLASTLLAQPNRQTIPPENRQPENRPPAERNLRDPAQFPNGFHHLGQNAVASIVALEAIDRRTSRPCRFGTGHGTFGRGGGFVIEPGDVIVTNANLVAGARRIRIRANDGTEYWASSLAYDPLTNLAIVRAPAPFGLPALPLADSDLTQVGDWVVAVGSPWSRLRGSELNLSSGIISGRRPLPDWPGSTDFLQTDAMINAANRGGPLLNLDGQVVGLNTMTDGLEVATPGFALPSSQINWVTRELIDHGTVRRSYLGLQTQPVTPRDLPQQQPPNPDAPIPTGVLVTKVQPGSPAERADIRPGDILVSLNMQDIISFPQLHNRAERLTPGETYPAEIIRDGKRSTVNIVPTAHVYRGNLAPRTITLDTSPIVDPVVN